MKASLVDLVVIGIHYLTYSRFCGIGIIERCLVKIDVLGICSSKPRKISLIYVVVALCPCWVYNIIRGHFSFFFSFRRARRSKQPIFFL